MAHKGQWDELIGFQKKLSGGKKEAKRLTNSKLEKYLIRTGAIRPFTQDDLKAIEGIGPAIEKLLHENGIKTWGELAKLESSKIQKILDSAGSRFKLADPGTWPKQANMAAKGNFDELREYQDFLTGGRSR